jgi:hypothetical protein
MNTATTIPSVTCSIAVFLLTQTVSFAIAPRPLSEGASSTPASTKDLSSEVAPAPGEKSEKIAAADNGPRAAAVDSAAEQPVHLKYRYSVGQTFRYRTLKTATTEATLNEHCKVDKTETEEHRLFTVTSVSDSGVADITMQYEFVRMQIQTDDRPVEIFTTRMSTDEIPPSLQNAAAQLRGKAAHFRLGGNGRHATSLDQSEKAETASVRETDSYLIPLPDEPVTVGETWSQKQTATVRINREISRKVEILQTFRLLSVVDGLATISLNSSINAPSLSPHVKAQLIQSTPKGTLVFDIEKGIMVRKSWRFDQMVINAMGDNTILRSMGTYLDEHQPENAPLSGSVEQVSNAGP